MQGRSVRNIILIAAGAALLLALSYSYLFGPKSEDTTKIEFIITPGTSVIEIADRLKRDGLVRNKWAFEIAYVRSAGINGVRPGGYQLSASMDAWTIASTLTESPYLAWVVIPRGVRKEQIADILTSSLNWSQEQKEQWLTIDTNPSPSYIEGVYYPDTYLIASDESPAQVAARMRDRFMQLFDPYAKEAAQKGIKWTTVLNIASLIEREAAGPDRALIAGIIWNRLDQNMKLQIDATLQYIKGNAEDGWWGVVKSEDKYLESPFNTYMYEGLPPHPIAEPSLEAIHAVLNPEETNCLFYLHDNRGQIHCSPNYKGHVANVNKYLK